MDTPARCDLHVHSIYSTDTGNFALRRARLGESYTEPRRIYDVCRRRGMSFVTISDHNTVEGALRIAHLPGTFLSVEVTTRFPEDDVPLHVLVWGLERGRPSRPSAMPRLGLRARRLPARAAAGARARSSALPDGHIADRLARRADDAAVRRLGGSKRCPSRARRTSSRAALARAATPSYLAKLAERHGFEPCAQPVSRSPPAPTITARSISPTPGQRRPAQPRRAFWKPFAAARASRPGRTARR